MTCYSAPTTIQLATLKEHCYHYVFNLHLIASHVSAANTYKIWRCLFAVPDWDMSVWEVVKVLEHVNRATDKGWCKGGVQVGMSVWRIGCGSELVAMI